MYCSTLRTAARLRWLPPCRRSSPMARFSSLSAELASGAREMQAQELQRITVYESPRSLPISFATRLAALKSYVATVGLGYSLHTQYVKFASWDELYQVLMGMEPPGAPGLDLRYAGLCAIAAIVGRAVSQTLSGRTVLKVDVEMPKSDAATILMDVSLEACTRSAPDDPWAERNRRRQQVAQAVTGTNVAAHKVFITRPYIWSGVGVQEVKRSDITCAPPNTLTQCFQLRSPSGRFVEQYLYPAKGWKSGAPSYLKAMLYSDYFVADEAAPRPDVEAIAIEGFGAYRPAQFADPLHPQAIAMEKQAALLVAGSKAAEMEPNGALKVTGGFGELVLPDTSTPVAVPATPFYIQAGAVWADFKQPAPLTIQEKRAIERDNKLHGRSMVRIDKLPEPAGSVAIMLDGSTDTTPRLLFTNAAAKVPEIEASDEEKGKPSTT